MINDKILDTIFINCTVAYLYNTYWQKFIFKQLYDIGVYDNIGNIFNFNSNVSYLNVWFSTENFSYNKIIEKIKFSVDGGFELYLKSSCNGKEYLFKFDDRGRIISKNNIQYIYEGNTFLIKEINNPIPDPNTDCSTYLKTQYKIIDGKKRLSTIYDIHSGDVESYCYDSKANCISTITYTHHLSYIEKQPVQYKK